MEAIAAICKFCIGWSCSMHGRRACGGVVGSGVSSGEQFGIGSEARREEQRHGV